MQSIVNFYSGPLQKPFGENLQRVKTSKFSGHFIFISNVKNADKSFTCPLTRCGWFVRLLLQINHNAACQLKVAARGVVNYQ